MFCQRPADSGEHRWPDWISSVILEQTETTGFVLTRGKKFWPAQRLSDTINRYCQECNSGWMSGIESATKSLLAPLIVSPAKRVMFPKSQRQIALWAYLRFLVMVSERPEYLPSQLYKEFYESLDVPTGFHVWLASIGGERTGGGGVVAQRLNLSASDGFPTDYGYAATIHAHRVVIQTMLYRGPGTPNVGVNPSYFIRIWPTAEPYMVHGSRRPLAPTDIAAVINDERLFLN